MIRTIARLALHVAARLGRISVLACACGFAGTTFAQGVPLPADANIVNVALPPYNALGNGVTDNLSAFQAACNAVAGTNRVLYIPDGTYRLSGRLNTIGLGSGGFFWIQGQSQAGTILKLDDGAAGFGDVANPRVFIDAYEGNSANQFRNYLRDVTIDIGAGNPGATGLQFQASNTGRVENVTIRSSDAQKRGAIGLDQNFAFPGPLLLRNITIDGFDTGYAGAPQEYSVTIENLTIRNQRSVGITVYRLPLQIRNLVSQNSVPVFVSISQPGAWGHLVVDGATITGLPGAESVDAFFNSNSGGVMLLRNINVTGYRSAINDQSFSTTNPIIVPTGFVSQFATDPVQSLNPSPSALMNLPIEDAPAVPGIPLSQWVSVKAFGAIENDNLDDTAAFQAALRSGAPVVYMPSGSYSISDTLEIGPSVQRIEGLLSQLDLNAPLCTENKALFRVPPGSQPVIHINGVQFNFASVSVTNGGGVWVEHAAATTLVVRDGDLDGYRNTVSGGKVFLENVVGQGMVFTGQRVWARQLNPEGSRFTHVINDGGDVYILGLKTEGSPTVLENRNRARTVVLGGLVYPSSGVTDRTTPMVINNESSLCWSMPESCYVNPINNYDIWVRETRSGLTSSFTRAMLPFGRGHADCGGMLNLYNGYQLDATPPTTPGTPTLVARTPSSISFSWLGSSDGESGIARYNIYRQGTFYRSMMPGSGTSMVDDALPDGTSFTYRVSAVNGSGVESALSGSLATGTLTDVARPRLIGVNTGSDPRRLVLTFSKPLASAPATTPANYSVGGPGGNVAVLSAALSGGGTTVTLTTAPLTAGTQRLSISNLQDSATTPNMIAPGSQTAFAFGQAATGTGLSGHYYLNNTFTGSPVLTRTDASIDFNWTGVSPGPGVPSTNYAVRWVGQLRPSFNEVYTLYARSDDGTRVFVDGVLLIDNWNDQGATELGATIALDSGRTYDIVLEYYQGGGGASVRFSWESASQPKQVIPAASLFPTPRLSVARTFDGAGADCNLARGGTDDNGAVNSMGAFHGPSGFHQAAYWRFDLSGFNLSNNYVVGAVATLSQTFFGIGDGKRRINLFAVNQSPGADAWIETGPGHVSWNTAPGNDDSGALCNPIAARWMSTYLLDNANYALNNRPDRNPFTGPRLVDAINADIDSRLTLFAKRVDASNEGQSWFTKEWGIPGFAPALKVELAPRCPQVLAAPVMPTSVSASNALTLLAVVSGAPPVTYQWLRSGASIEDGPNGAGLGSGVVSGSSGTITAAAAQTNVSLTLAGLTRASNGQYALRLTNACGNVTTTAVTLSVCIADYNNNGIINVQDIFDFLAGWFAADPKADVNGVNGITVQDIFDFLAGWFAGC